MGNSPGRIGPSGIVRASGSLSDTGPNYACDEGGSRFFFAAGNLAHAVAVLIGNGWAT
jgi:hypothetical protein